LPFKANADRRHHIPKQRYRVTNWAEYDAALRARQPDPLAASVRVRPSSTSAIASIRLAASASRLPG
jgi:hypothetical protein